MRAIMEHFHLPSTFHVLALGAAVYLFVQGDIWCDPPSIYPIEHPRLPRSAPSKTRKGLYGKNGGALLGRSEFMLYLICSKTFSFLFARSSSIASYLFRSSGDIRWTRQPDHHRISPNQWQRKSGCWGSCSGESTDLSCSSVGVTRSMMP